MVNSLSWIKSGNKITIVLESGKPVTINNTDHNFNEVLQAIKDKNWNKIINLIDPKTAIESFSNSRFIVKNGLIYTKNLVTNEVNEKTLPNELNNKILSFAKEGLPCEPLLNFWEKLQRNPSFRNVQGLFKFLDDNNYPITEEGNVIAYKKVKSDFYDFYTGKVLNEIGKTLSMPRNEVNDNPELACQFGFHCATFHFADKEYHSGEGIILMVEMDPEHIVSFPNSYEFQKLRTCQYKVLSIVQSEIKGNLYKTNDDSRYESDIDDSKNNDYNDDYWCISCDNEGCEDCEYD